MLGLADAYGVRQDGSEHGVKFAGKRTDDLQHFRGGCLLLQCLREVGCALGKVSGSLAQFVEQPRILDGDDRLGGEVLTNAICLSVKGRTSWRYRENAPISSVLLQHRHDQKGPYTAEFDGADKCRVAVLSVSHVRGRSANVNHRFCRNHAPNVFGLGRIGAAPACLGEALVAYLCRDQV